ncbi:hypothetical protein P7C71_g5555, partial [Lecanoromycetidae sp. Uapishka_2]
MPVNDQDVFETVTKEMNHVFESIGGGFESAFEEIDKHFESVSQSLKDTFRATPWLPDSIKPRPPPPPRNRIPPVPGGYFEASRIWISEHRAVTAAVVAFIGTGAFIVWRRRRSDRAKRRAKRAKNGSRTEVVVLAGSPHSPLTRCLSLELERRGFIIYIPVSSVSEEQIIHSKSKTDIRALNLDVTSPSSTEDTIQKFNELIVTPQRPTQNAPPHTLHLAAIILVPGQPLPDSPIASLAPSTWSDTLNTRLLAPFATLRAFLPLLASQSSTLLFLTPSIIPALSLPYHAAESVVAGGLQQYISTIRKEAQGINVVQIRMGHFDYGLAPSDEQQQLVRSQHMSVADATKQRLLQKGLVPKSAKGTSLRELHNSVFDAIVRGKGKNGTVFVGQGSMMYDLIGKFVPSGIVGWMMDAGKTSQIDVPVQESNPGQSVEWDKVGERSSDDEGYVYPKK